MTFTICTTMNNWNNPMVFWQDTLQTEDGSFSDAIEEWATVMINSEMLGRIKYETLINKVKKATMEMSCKNVWEFSIRLYKRTSLWVTIVKTDIGKKTKS